MKTKGFKKFILIWIVFTIGIFAGEYIIDLILKLDRDPVKTEFFQAVFVGLFVSIMLNLFVLKKQKQSS